MEGVSYIIFHVSLYMSLHPLCHWVLLGGCEVCASVCSQIPVVLFLQSVLSYQDKFSKHYADGLDGCGLQQEGRVRAGYYSLIRCLVEPFQKMRPHNVDSKVLPAYDFIQACLLHLLDTQWQVGLAGDGHTTGRDRMYDISRCVCCTSSIVAGRSGR